MALRKRTKAALAIVGGAATALTLRPSDRGAPHDPYFRALEAAIAKAPARPLLLLDLDRLDHNLDEVARRLRPPHHLRVVVKSLPSLELLEHVFARLDTRRGMVFHAPHVLVMARRFPDCDLLLGKPMPVAAAAEVYDGLGAMAAAPGERRFDPDRQLQWLIDTPQRLAGYQALARRLGRKLRVSLEIDVGLHRGGVPEPAALEPLLEAIAADPSHLELAGFMGYDVHAAHAPPLLSSPRKAVAAVEARYRAYVEHARGRHPKLLGPELCYDGAGSKTYQLYDAGTILNDFAVGSALVMPTDFDVATIEGHQPALFIATPILKRLEKPVVPFLDGLGPLWRAWDRNRQLTLFVYGGKWMARPVSPTGLVGHPLLGQSSNQDVLCGSRGTGAQVDEHVFYRPTQSEALMLEFGELWLVRRGEIAGRWSVFPSDGRGGI